MVGYQKLFVAGAIPANSLQDPGWWIGFLVARRDCFFEVDTAGSSVSIFGLVRISSLSRRGCAELSSV